MNVSFVLEGKMPLLMHHDDVEASDKLKKWQKSPENKNFSTPGDDRTPPWTWQTYLYRDEQDNVAIPSQNLMVCLRAAGTQKILKKQKTFKEITQSGLHIASEYLDFFTGSEGDLKQIPMASIEKIQDKPFSEQAEDVKKMGFVLFVKRAKIGRAKHVRVRPRFNRWRIEGQIEVTAQEITYEALKELFEFAGKVGLCDWRPGCSTPGPFGMFTHKLKKL